MISVLDINGVVKGQYVNNVPNACPYINDEFTENIATGVVTLSFEVPLANDDSNWLDGLSVIAYPDEDGDLRLFSIIQIYETYRSGEAYKRVLCEDISITDLNNAYSKPFNALTLEEAMQGALGDSGWGWELDYVASLEQDKIIIVEEYISARSALTRVADAFKIEYKFIMKIDEFGQTEKVVKVFGKLGVNSGKYFIYERDLVGLERTIEYSDVKTAVFPTGKNADGNIITLTGWVPPTPVQGFTKELNWDLVVADEAHALYDPFGVNGVENFRILISNTGLADKELMYLQAISELIDLTQPVYTYTMDVLLLENVANFYGEDVRVGDTVWAKDKAGKQEIGVEARVIQKITSHTNPENNQLTFSNFKEIDVADSDDIKALREQVEKVQNDLNNQQNELDSANQQIAELKVTQEGIVTSLDGKSSISVGNTPNPNPNNGDTWFKPAKDAQGRDYVVINTWNAVTSTWVPQVDTSQIGKAQDAADSAQLEAEEALANANTATGKANTAITNANAAAAEAKKAIEGQGNLVNNFSVSGNFDRWGTGSLGGLVMQTVPFLNGQDVKALYSSGEANQIYRSVRQKLDPTKMYEVSIWVLAENDLNNYYFGLETDGGVTRVNKNTGQATSNDTNPYFIQAIKAPTAWTKYTGYFAPNGTDPLTLRDAGGNNLNNFIQTQTNNSFSMRILNYPTTMPRKMWFANPSIFEVNPDQMNRNASFKVGMEAISLSVSNKANQADFLVLANQVTTTVTELNQVQAGRNFQRDIQVGYQPAPAGTTITKVGTNSLDIAYPGGSVPDAYAWLQDMPELVNGVTYTLKASIILKNSTTATNLLGVGVRQTGSADKRDTVLNKLNYVPVTITFKYVKPPTGNPRVIFFPITRSDAFTINVKDVSVTEGSVAPAQWFPSFLDYASQTQIVQLTDQISLVAQTSEQNKADITLLTNNINLMVRKDDVVNQINISTEGILIDGEKVHITGQTTIDNAVIKDAMIASLTADKLTAGEINASIIRVINLDASEIKSGIISAIDIVGSTITNSFDFVEGSNRFIGTSVLAKNKLSFNYAISGGNTTGIFEVSPLAINSTILNAGAFVSGWEISGTGYYFVNGNPSAGGSSLTLGVGGINVMKNGGGVQYEYGGEGMSIRPVVGTSTVNSSLEMYGMTTYIDMHSNNNTNDYGVRLQATGGNATAGSSILKITASQVDFSLFAGGMTINGNNISVNDHLYARVPAFATLRCATNAGAWRPMQASSFDVQSDMEDKKNITSLENALAKVLDTPVYNYNRSDEFDWEIKHTGLMLQDSPVDIVSPSGSIDIYGATSLAFGAIQELNTKLEKENTAIREENDELRATLDAFEARLSAIENK